MTPTQTTIPQEKQSTRLQTIVNKGVIIGGLIPILINLILATVLLWPNIESKVKVLWWEPTWGVVLLFLAFLVTAFGALVFWAALQVSLEKNQKLSGACSAAIAVLCVVLVHFSVMLSGGGNQSIMSLHYFYIPAITLVAYDYRSAKQIAWVCVVSFLLTTFPELNNYAIFRLVDYFMVDKNLMDWWAGQTTTIAFRISYFLVFLIQLLMVVRLGGSNNYSKNGVSATT